MAKSRASGGGWGKFLVGLLLGVALLVGGGAAYLRWGAMPVATADKALPFEKDIVDVPLDARIDREKKTPPFGISEDVYEGGAKIYRAQCAACHGTPGNDVGFAKYMYPAAPPLWKRHAHAAAGTIGVSDDEPGETYWKIANGIRLSGMPAYGHVLTDTQIWQVTLLLKNADQPLPDPVTKILTEK